MDPEAFSFLFGWPVNLRKLNFIHLINLSAGFLGRTTRTQCGCGGHRVKKGTTGKFIDRHMIGCFNMFLLKSTSPAIL